MSRSLRVLFRDWLNRSLKSKAGALLAKRFRPGASKVHGTFELLDGETSQQLRPEVSVMGGITPAGITFAPAGMFIEDAALEGDVLVIPLDARRELVFKRLDPLWEGQVNTTFGAPEVQPARSLLPHPPIEARGVLWSMPAARGAIEQLDSLQLSLRARLAALEAARADDPLVRTWLELKSASLALRSGPIASCPDSASLPAGANDASA